MSQFSVRYPTTNKEHFAISQIGKLRDCKFYISSPGYENSGLAFRVAFDAVKKSSNHKDLCTYVGSMICAVSNDLTNSVLTALHEVGVQPRFVELPFQAREHSIDEARVTEMEWPLILLNFGLICILLLRDTDEKSYHTFMSNCIRELQNRVGYEPKTQFSDPFYFSRANAIRTLLGASLSLREALVKLIMANMNDGPASICSVCQYLFNLFSWYGMDDLILLNEKLVMPKSSVLCERWNSREAENLAEACAAIESHPYPQFFMILASNVELMKVNLSRFPRLIQKAKEMELEKQGYYDDSD